MYTPEELADLRVKLAAYIAKCRDRGETIIEFDLPCGHKSKTPAGHIGQREDTCAICEHCGALYVKITIRDRVDALDPNHKETT